MKISIFGSGYISRVSLGRLEQNGQKDTGIDILPFKADLINLGKPTIIEKDINHIIAEQYLKDNISAISDYDRTTLKSNISIICVGTHSHIKVICILAIFLILPGK
jgi:UDP-glucose 6-dehydrogenase